MKRRPAPKRAATARTLELVISELSPGGDGVGICEIDGERRAVFVPQVAPGERVRVEADVTRRPARGRLLEVLATSPARVAPSCGHHARCGACDWMFLSSAAQAEAHVAIVRAVMPPPYRDVVVTPHHAASSVGCRTRARVHVDAGRSGKIAVGMYGRGTREPVVVDACVVLHPALERARASLPSWLAGARGHGEARLSLGAPGETPRRAVLDLTWSGELVASAFASLEQATRGELLAGASVRAGEVRVPAVIGDPTPWIAGADGAPLRLASGGFSQASEEGNATLAQHVAESARALLGDSASPDASLLELYAGAGNLTVLLARLGRVLAVESDAQACVAARANLAARGLDRAARVVEADAASYPVPAGTKLVVLDPPRTGARDVARALAARRVPGVVYVSCDPPTLGRDLAVLAEAGYALRSLDTFEMFPQTSHVETVAVLVGPSRRQGAPAPPRAAT